MTTPARTGTATITRTVTAMARKPERPKSKRALLRRRPELRARRAAKEAGAKKARLRGDGQQSFHHYLSPGGRGRRREAPAGEGDRAGSKKQPPSPRSRTSSARHPLPQGEREVDVAALHRLLAWLSPSYPVGAFSFSSGIEWAVQAGDIRDAATLQDWLATMLARGAGFCDAVFFAHAHGAAERSDDAALRAVAELAGAFAPSKERQLETTAQGRAFVEVTQAAWPCAALDRLAAIWDGPLAYPVAVGVAAAGHRIALAPALAAFLHALAANWISAGVRLIPLGQTDGQRVLAALAPAIGEAAQRAAATALDDVGGAAIRADLAAMRHETQYTRLFRS
jgi:urease accessory protein